MKKITTIFVIIITLLTMFSTNVFASDDVVFKEVIKKEEGSLFEKIIAETIRRNCTSCI